MSTPLQFTTDGKMTETLDAVPWQGYASSSDIASKLKISPSLAAARLKLLFDNDVVKRVQIGNRFFYTRGNDLFTPEETETVSTNMTREASKRPIVAAYLKKNIGEHLSVENIVEATGVDYTTVRSMMHNLNEKPYVTAYTDGTYEINQDIESYRPCSVVKQKGGTVNQVQEEKLDLSNLAEGLQKLQAQRDNYRATLQLMAEMIQDALKG